MSGMRNYTVTVTILRGRRRREVDIFVLASTPECAVQIALRAVSLEKLLREEEEIIGTRAVEDSSARPLPRRRRRPPPAAYIAKVAP